MDIKSKKKLLISFYVERPKSLQGTPGEYHKLAGCSTTTTTTKMHFSTLSRLGSPRWQPWPFCCVARGYFLVLSLHVEGGPGNFWDLFRHRHLSHSGECCPGWTHTPKALLWGFSWRSLSSAGSGWVLQVSFLSYCSSFPPKAGLGQHTIVRRSPDSSFYPYLVSLFVWGGALLVYFC